MLEVDALPTRDGRFGDVGLGLESEVPMHRGGFGLVVPLFPIVN